MSIYQTPASFSRMHFLGKGFPLKQDNEHKTLKDYLKPLLSHLTWTPSEYLWDTKSEKGNFSRNIQMDYQVFQKCVKSKIQLRSTYIFWRSRCSLQFCQYNKMILTFKLKKINCYLTAPAAWQEGRRSWAVGLGIILFHSEQSQLVLDGQRKKNLSSSAIIRSKF